MKRLCMGCMHEYDAKYDVCPFCGYVYGTPPKEAYHMTPGTILNNKYIIGKVLGFGGFGITYIAYDKILEQRVAIKEYMPGEFSTRMPEQSTVTVFSGEREEQFREGLKKIEEEAKRLSKFSSVPNIVHIFDCFQANNTVYIVMEYLDGESLKDKLSRDGRMPVQDAYDIVIKVISAMKMVHKEGMIHRDIAPDNIFILKNGDIKVIDFGAARYATTKHSKSLSVIIKPGYAPEEQYRSRGDQGPHTDVYALAATFYKMITGVTPEDAMERSVKDMLKPPSKMGVDISKPMDVAIMNALMVNIDDRTPTMDEFEKELNDADVKERKKTASKDTSGSMPLPIKISIGVGASIVSIALLAVLTINVAPRLGIDKILGATEVTVPNIVNQDYESIKNNDDLKIKIFDTKFNDDYIKGRVIEQDPTGGMTVPKGTEIHVSISEGARPMLIPNVVGMRVDEAKNIAGKLYKNVICEPSEDDMSSVAPGAVVSQSQQPYSDTIKTGYGDSITLKYNANGFDAGTYTASETATVVPSSIDINSKILSNIQNDFYNSNSVYLSPVYILKDIQKNKYIRVDEYNQEEQDYLEVNVNVPNDISVGSIVAEDTDENANNRDKLLHVYVYDGVKPFEAENYKGKSLEEIQNLLTSAGINVSTQYEFSSEVNVNCIIRTMDAGGGELAAGSVLHSGNSITLIVNNGDDPHKSVTETKKQETKQVPETTKAKVETSVVPETTKAKETQTQKAPETENTAPPETTTARETVPPATQNVQPDVVKPRRIERNTEPDENGESGLNSDEEGGGKKKKKKKKDNKNRERLSFDELPEDIQDKINDGVSIKYQRESSYIDENGERKTITYYYDSDED